MCFLIPDSSLLFGYSLVNASAFFYKNNKYKHVRIFSNTTNEWYHNPFSKKPCCFIPLKCMFFDFDEPVDIHSIKKSYENGDLMFAIGTSSYNSIHDTIQILSLSNYFSAVNIISPKIPDELNIYALYNIKPILNFSNFKQYFIDCVNKTYLQI